MKTVRLVLFLFLVLVCALILSSCKPEQVEVTAVVTVEVGKEKEVEVTRVVEVEKPVEVLVEVEKEVEVTRLVETDPRFGGVFKMAVVSAAPSLDTMRNSVGATCYGAQQFMETLVAYDENYQVAPNLAESWETSDGGKTVTFKLHQGVKFHNGKEMTAEDVVASVDRYMLVSPRLGQFSLLESWEAIDDYTVAFHLSEPSYAFLEALAYPVGELVIMPKEVLERVGADDIAVEDLIGTGPYKLVEWIPQQIIRYERFDDYAPRGRGTDGLAGGKIAFFDEVQRLFVPEAASRVAGIETGEYDWAEAIPATDYQRLQDTEGVCPYIKMAANAYYALFNHTRFPTSDVNFRKALLVGIDMEEIGLAMSNGIRDFFRLNPSVWAPEGPFYIESEQALELYNKRDVELAKELIEASGYNGEEIILLTNKEYDGMYKLIVTMADQMEKRLGLNVTVEILDWPTQLARLAEADTWNVSTTFYLSANIFSPDSLAMFWHCESTSAVGGFYCNEEMDAAFEAGAKAATFEERYAAFEEVQRIYYETLPQMKVVEYFDVEALACNIKGHQSWYRANRPWGMWRE